MNSLFLVNKVGCLLFRRAMILGNELESICLCAQMFLLVS